MTVVHITNSYSATIGGAERIVRYIHTHSLANGVDSKVIGLYHNNPNQENLPKAITIGDKTPYGPRVVWALYKALKRYNKPSCLLHVHLFPAIFYIALFKKLGLLKAKTVVTEHSTSNNRRAKWYGKFLDRFIFRSYQKVFAISEGVAESLIERSIIKSNQVEVVTNGAILPFSAPIERSRKSPIEIISVGSLRKAKNFENALKALSSLTHLNWHYTIAGEGELQEKLEMLIRKEGLVDHVTLAGRVDPLNDFLTQGDLFLMPSAWEGFGLAAVEAMNASLPVVLSNVAGLKELVHFNESTLPFAKLVNPQDISEIAEVLEEVLVNFEKYRSFAPEAFEHSLKFSSQAMADKYITQYQMLG